MESNIVLERYGVKPPNRPLQPPGTRLQAGAARRAGSHQRLKRSVMRHIELVP
jgi:hypothetical protein